MDIKTPEDCKKELAQMRMVNPFVNKAMTAQEINQWSKEDTYAVIALHAPKSLEETQAAYVDAMNRRGIP